MFQINITCLLYNSVNNVNSTFHTDFKNINLFDIAVLRTQNCTNSLL